MIVAYQNLTSHATFSPTNKVSVKFTDDAGVSEGAVDLGGPMREFFNLFSSTFMIHNCSVDK